MTRVAVDALGGDNAPGEVILGALAAAASGTDVVLYGPAHLDTQGLPLVETTEAIAMSDKPAEAVRAKPDSSLVAAVRAVGDGHADAVVSAGNTGAMLAAGLLHLRRLPGVMRPAIAVPIPAVRGVSVLIDSGANADGRPEHGYHVDLGSGQALAGLAQAVGGTSFGERELGRVVGAARAALGSGPTQPHGRTLNTRALAPFVILASLIPLLLLLGAGRTAGIARARRWFRRDARGMIVEDRPQ